MRHYYCTHACQLDIQREAQLGNSNVMELCVGVKLCYRPPFAIHMFD